MNCVMMLRRTVFSDYYQKKKDKSRNDASNAHIRYRI